MALQSFDYVIVGGGMTADSAVKGIRLTDRSKSVCVIGDEHDPPYNRPPLSKGLWSGLPLDAIYRPRRGAGITVVLGRQVVELDAVRRFVKDQRGDIYRFGQLLLATGGRPRRLPGTAEGVVYFRTLADFRRLQSGCAPGAELTLVGGGLMAAELAGVLARAGCRVRVLLPATQLGASMLPPALADELALSLRRAGVQLEHGVRIVAANAGAAGTQLQYADGRSSTARWVVAALGIEPNEELAQRCGIRCDDGVLVDAHLQTSIPGIYAAGDVARFFQPDLQRWIRPEHEENANVGGLAAGRAMAGSGESYAALPYIYSSVLDCDFEGVGVLDARLEIRTVRKNGAAISYYLEGERIRGVLFWNCRADVETAQSLIRQGRTELLTPATLPMLPR